MMQFESILKQTGNSSKIEKIKDNLQYCWGKFLDNFFYLPWHWFKVRFITKHRYHILDLTKGGNGYQHGWYDTDRRMLQACFLLLVEYVEIEKPFEIADWECDERHKHVASEIKDLYYWWKIERAQKRAEVSAAWAATDEEPRFISVEGGGFTINMSEAHKGLISRENELDEEDQHNLERLIKIRGWLWT